MELVDLDLLISFLLHDPGQVTNALSVSGLIEKN